MSELGSARAWRWERPPPGKWVLELESPPEKPVPELGPAAAWR